MNKHKQLPRMWRPTIPLLLSALPPQMRLNCLLELLNSPTEDAFESKYAPAWEKLGTASDAWKLRAEILRDLEPLVEPRTPKQARDALSNLVNKINSMRLRCFWVIAPGTRNWIDPRDKTKKFNFFWLRLGAEQRVIEFGNEKSIVTMIFFDWGNSRKVLYSIILNALQNGAIEHLRRCKWKDCKKFFTTRDLRKKSFCTAKCEKLSKNYDSRIRMNNWRRFKRYDASI